MSPEREVSEEQLGAIYKWVGEVKGGRTIRTYYPGAQSGVFEVDGEPMVVFGPVKNTLLCSDRHAKELEEAGIVSFSETEVSQS